MPDRRQFFRAAGAGLAALATGRAAPGAQAAPGRLSYAIHAELAWKNLPFLDRLRKVSEAGFGRYEFWRWRTKDIEAIARLGDELGIQAALFTGYWAAGGPKWKDGLIQAVGDSAELAPRLGASKLAIVPPAIDPDRDRDDQAEELVDALGEAAEKVAGAEVTLILEAAIPPPGRARSLVATPEEAAAIVRSVGSPRVRFAFEVRRRRPGEAPPIESIRALRDQAGHYRIADLGHPDVRPGLPEILRAILGAGHDGPIGLAIADRVDPAVALDDLRKADREAQAG